MKILNLNPISRILCVWALVALSTPRFLSCGFSSCGEDGIANNEASAKFQVLPESIKIHGKRQASVVVQRQSADGTLGSQMRDGVQLRIEDSSVARVRNGRVVAVGDGKTNLVVRTEGSAGEQRIPVTVSGTALNVAWEFDAHVQSVLSRSGCNSGACHGALAGKGGFSLSLRGYDSLADHFAITRQDRGRRIEPADPGRSLLLAKPTRLIPHKGGLRIKPGSDDYRILADWIANDSPGPHEDDAALSQVQVLPEELTLKPGSRQQLVVLAHYEDGRTEDVTHWAKFSSSSEAVATVDENGEVTVVGNGKSAVVVWFASRITISSLIVPYQASEQIVAQEGFQPNNLIDEILRDEWKALGLVPSPACSDATFIRRAYLSATGTLPSPQRVRQFIANTDPNRWAQLVDEVLESKEYVDYWSYQWSDLLLVNGNLLRPDAIASFYKWIRGKVQANAPWDEFAREIVLARGESLDQGATNFYAIHQTPESITENTCQAFLGLSIGCAKCHNHPLEKWTNDQYYAMANIYARVRAKGWGGDSRNGDGKRTLLVLQRGDLIQPSRGKPQPPAPLDSPPIDIDSTDDRREVMADWLTSNDNRFFSRAIVNRVWANYMGVGLISPVDDLRASNPASSERLLNALADYLIQEEYDLKSLTRLIMNSQVYRRTSRAVEANKEDTRFFSRYFPQRLMAEVLHDAIVSVTGVPSKFTEIEFPGADKKPTDFYEEGTKSIELYDSAVANYFLKTFGRHQRRITCACERSDQPTVVQALHLNNGDTINEKLSAADNVVGQWMEQNVSLKEVVEDAYLLTLSRFPSDTEQERMLTLIADADKAEVSRRESYEDLLWSLMTSREFLFSH